MTGSMISPRGLKLLIPSRTMITPARRSKSFESRKKTPIWDMNRPSTKKTTAMPRVKATPIMNPSLEVEALARRYSSFLRTVIT
ncbi:MAG: hypothetical protein A4E43_00719 [Methanosaeta sp. PtaB.Bin005]|nr:MAG: hypothetical protein A4E43_00719 [Methanosaeta sp. PtaB.Bin005]